MTDRPIIFSAPMILALLAGRKTMTRRLARTAATQRPSYWTKAMVGDRLWTREAIGWDADDGTLFYKADNTRVPQLPPNGYRVTLVHIPGIFAPRWASRLTLIVTATRIERLQDITEAEAMAEGLLPCANIPTPNDWFTALWDSLHGPGSWDANPEVVCLSFRCIKANIDQEPPQ